MKQSTPPFVCHVFVCTNDRNGARKSCADGDNVDTRAKLKQAIAERGLKGTVRVSACGCLGLCEQGPNVIIYPQRNWYSEVRADDVGTILAHIDEVLSSGK